jgi:plasmid maintenance system antidote protein VapI
MAAVKEHRDFNIEFGPNDGHKWSREKLAETDEIAREIASKRSPEMKLKNRMLSIRYRMEEYLQNQAIDENELLNLDSWLKDYLKVLNLTQKKFAEIIESKDGNLKKYLIGKRKFSTDLAMKFGHFFHTAPDLWLNIQIKNDVLLLKKEKETAVKYEKYDYEKVLEQMD